jgi:hypothetical protein
VVLQRTGAGPRARPVTSHRWLGSGGDPAGGPAVRCLPACSAVPLALPSRSPPAASKAPPSLLARSSLVSPGGADGPWLAGSPAGAAPLPAYVCLLPPPFLLTPSFLPRSSAQAATRPFGSRGCPFASGVPGGITGTRISSSRFDVGERPCPGNVLVYVTHTRIKRDGGHAATMRSRQGRARSHPRPGPAPVR